MADIVRFSSQVGKVRALSLKSMLASAFKSSMSLVHVPESLCTKIAHLERVLSNVCAINHDKNNEHWKLTVLAAKEKSPSKFRQSVS